MTTEFSRDDLIFYNEDGKIKSGGYSIESALLQKGVRGTYQEGGKKMTPPFENLAVPVGIYYVNQKFPKSDEGLHYKEHTPISDDLYDKLFELASFQKAKSAKKTKKRATLGKKKNTRRQK